MLVDLFCGGGGFSEGARLAGCRTVLAVDCDAKALEVHEENHPDAEHMCAELPSEDVERRIAHHVERGAHLHASPPCQLLSQANRNCRSEENPLSMVSWYIAFVLSTRPRSWTMEQVGVPLVRNFLASIRKMHPDVVDFVLVNASAYGVPQDRKRLIAGPPHLISALRTHPPTIPKPRVRDVFPHPPGTHIQSTTTNTPCRGTTSTHRPLLPNEHIRSIDQCCYTILARQAPWWCDEHGTRIRRLTPNECASIQTFPSDYNFSQACNSVVQRIVGNAVPPRLAAVIMAYVDPVA